MRIACFQGPEAADTPAGNLGRLRRVAGEAKAGGAGLLVCPEMFLTGYALGKEEVARHAEPLDGASVTQARALAAETGIALALGLPEREGGKVFNAAVAIGADGSLLASYRKTHLFGDVDRDQFSAGDEAPAIFEIGGLKAALLICYDVEFPEAARALALAGADLVLVPTALMKPFDVVAKIIVPARAYENQIVVAYANRCGREADFDYCGLSCVVGSDGADLARAGCGEELIFADIDKAALARLRKQNPYLKDRRPELYGRIAEHTESAT